ncbi:lipase maturation factor family protein, partial [Microbacterium sp.]|uniref:lipase maturation factor family protein n=1 Tax=Microbacterium sp. TaxID=51671 RepID=UPI003F99AEE5
MDGFAAVGFWFAREVLQRGIAALYLVAFVSTLNQFRPLLGERGLLPAPALLAWAAGDRRRRRLLRPTLFLRWRYTDRRLAALCWVGIVVAAALAAGVPQLGPPWVPMLCFLALWLGYMSIVNIGQTFYSFGWEMLLLEAGFLAAFLGSGDQPPATVVIVLLWWLVFRLEFGAGMIKIRGGREWRDLTALMYHHETQPMPGPLSRTA